MDIEKIGGFVYTEIHGMCTWIGGTVNIWAKFDSDPSKISLRCLRKHLVEVKPMERYGGRPEGYISATAFILKGEG